MQASGNLKILTGSLWFLGLIILTAFVLHSSFQSYYISFFFCCPIYLIHGPFIWCWKICFLLGDFYYELSFFFSPPSGLLPTVSLTRVFSLSLAVWLQVLDSKDHAFWDCFLVCSTSSIWLVMSVTSHVRWNAHCVLWLRLMYQTSLLYLAVDSGSSLWGLRGLPVDVQVLSGKKKPWTPFEEGKGWQPHCFSYAGVVLFGWLKRWRCEKKWNEIGLCGLLAGQAEDREWVDVSLDRMCLAHRADGRVLLRSQLGKHLPPKVLSHLEFAILTVILSQASLFGATSKF